MSGIQTIKTTARSKRLSIHLPLACLIGLMGCDTDKIGIGDMFNDLANPDMDGDGFTVNDGDCDDNNANVHPGALEICDGLDNDCNSKIDNGMLTWEWNNDHATWVVGEGVKSLIIEQDSRGWDSMDMMADGIIDEKRVLHFDGNGRVLFDEIDRNLDGEIDLRIEKIYTGGGLIREINTDQHADGVIDIKESFNYLGKTLLDKTTDIGADGEIDSIQRWNHDSNGLLLSVTIDSDADGEIDSGTWFHYDESGLLISEVNRQNGVQTGSKLYAYNDRGELLYVDIDSEKDSDNIIDQRQFESEDIANQLKVVEIDHDLDGEIDEIHTAHFDAEGRLRKIEKDYDLDQDADHLFALVYGDEGLVVMESQDLRNGDEEGFEVSHVRGNRWESIRTINTGMFEAMIEQKLQFECEVPLVTNE